MRSGKHLTSSERRVIHFFIKSGLKQYEISKNIGVSPSTLSYELKNNTKSNDEYDPEYAQEKYLKRRTRSIKKSKFVKNLDLLNFTISGLQKYWPPEQISGKLKMLYGNDETMMITAEGIYLNIYNGVIGKNYIKYLRQNRRKRYKRSLKNKKRVTIKDKKNIKSRPEIVNMKNRLGDWEGDTIVGKQNQGYIATFVDRKSSYLAASLMLDNHYFLTASRW